MPPFTHHIFVCCNQRAPGHSRGCCDPDGSGSLRDLFKVEVKRRGLAPLVRANKAGCLDQCELGPTVVVYPQGIWYGNVQPQDVERIIEETIVHGRIVEDLRIPVELLNTKGGKAPPPGEAPVRESSLGTTPSPETPSPETPSPETPSPETPPASES